MGKMIKYFFLFLVLIFQTVLIPQQSDSPDTIDISEYLFFAEEMPHPIGGVEGIAEKLVYTEEALRAEIQGRVYIQAFINENGDVTKIKVKKSLGYGLDENASNIILNTKFKPGKNKGMPVKVFIVMPIEFKLK